jgi:hypothetical protein
MSGFGRRVRLVDMKPAKPSERSALTYPALCAAAYAVVENMQDQHKRAKVVALQLLAQLRAALGLEDRPAGTRLGGLRYVDPHGEVSDTPQELAIHRMKSLPMYSVPGFWWRFVLTLEEPHSGWNRAFPIQVWLRLLDDGQLEVKVMDEDWAAVALDEQRAPTGEVFARQVVTHVQKATLDVWDEAETGG